MTADGRRRRTLTVTVEDAQGNPIAGQSVTLSASGSDNAFGTISGTTNAKGVFTTTLSSTLAQTETITATEGAAHETTSVTFTSATPATGRQSSQRRRLLAAQQGVATAITGVSLSETGDTAGETFAVTLSDAHGNLAATGQGVTGSGTQEPFDQRLVDRSQCRSRNADGNGRPPGRTTRFPFMRATALVGRPSPRA